MKLPVGTGPRVFPIVRPSSLRRLEIVYNEACLVLADPTASADGLCLEVSPHCITCIDYDRYLLIAYEHIFKYTIYLKRTIIDRIIIVT